MESGYNELQGTVEKCSLYPSVRYIHFERRICDLLKNVFKIFIQYIILIAINH